MVSRIQRKISGNIKSLASHHQPASRRGLSDGGRRRTIGIYRLAAASRDQVGAACGQTLRGVLALVFGNEQENPLRALPERKELRVGEKYGRSVGVARAGEKIVVGASPNEQAAVGVEGHAGAGVEFAVDGQGIFRLDLWQDFFDERFGGKVRAESAE